MSCEDIKNADDCNDANKMQMKNILKMQSDNLSHWLPSSFESTLSAGIHSHSSSMQWGWTDRNSKPLNWITF